MAKYSDRLRDEIKRTRSRSNNAAEIINALLEQKRASGGVPQGAPARGGSPSPASTPPGKGGAGVDGWVNEALRVLKLDASYAPGIRNMIMKESGGNPKAINNWDSNAKKGTPSKGLMQTIDPTFKQWALPGYNKDVYDPISNIIAGIRYAQNRYGDSMLKSGGRKNSSGKYIGY